MEVKNFGSDESESPSVAKNLSFYAIFPVLGVSNLFWHSTGAFY